jgi:hypothetical protein
VAHSVSDNCILLRSLIFVFIWQQNSGFFNQMKFVFFQLRIQFPLLAGDNVNLFGESADCELFEGGLLCVLQTCTSLELKIALVDS